MKVNKIKKYLKKPMSIVIFLDMKGLFHIDDENYIESLYKIKLDQKLNLDNPQTFNEKLQWLKLYDRNPEYTNMVDKYEVKKYVAGMIGEEYIIPTLGIYDKFEDIDFDKLPNQFVLKCTHDSGGIVICKDKSKLNIKEARKKLNKSLKNNYYYAFREWPYKDVKPRIIAEKYMGFNLQDYKFFCFNGNPKIVLVCSNRANNLEETFFDNEWNQLDLKRPEHGVNNKIMKPQNLELMLKLASEISNGKKFVRVDFYEIDKKVYFGEITFYPAGGFEGFQPEEWDLKLGEWIDLTKD